MFNQYGGQSTSWPLPKRLPPPLIKEIVQELVPGPEKPSPRVLVEQALSHLALHPDAALLAYRLLCQRFAISG